MRLIKIFSEGRAYRVPERCQVCGQRFCICPKKSPQFAAWDLGAWDIAVQVG